MSRTGPSQSRTRSASSLPAACFRVIVHPLEQANGRDPALDGEGLRAQIPSPTRAGASMTVVKTRRRVRIVTMQRPCRVRRRGIVDAAAWTRAGSCPARSVTRSMTTGVLLSPRSPAPPRPARRRPLRGGGVREALQVDGLTTGAGPLSKPCRRRPGPYSPKEVEVGRCTPGLPPVERSARRPGRGRSPRAGSRPPTTPGPVGCAAPFEGKGCPQHQARRRVKTSGLGPRRTRRRESFLHCAC